MWIETCSWSQKPQNLQVLQTKSIDRKKEKFNVLVHNRRILNMYAQSHQFPFSEDFHWYWTNTHKIC